MELTANPNVALAALMHRMIPAVLLGHYDYFHSECAIEVQVTCSRDKLLREAEDMAASPAWKEIEAQRRKWTAMLPKNVAHLLPWLLEQSEDVSSNLFAFCVAATLDSVSGTDNAHPINALSDVLNLDMAKCWTPTRESYRKHASKARLVEIVSGAVLPDAAGSLAGLKKNDAAEAAELRLVDCGWLPEVLTNRETPKVDCYGLDDDEITSSDEEQEAAQAPPARAIVSGLVISKRRSIINLPAKYNQMG